MALDEDQIRLILDTTEAQSSTHKLAERVLILQERLNDLKDDFRAGDFAVEEYINRQASLQEQLKTNATVLEEVAGKTQQLTDEAETGGGFGGLSKNVFKAERALDLLIHPGGGLGRAGPLLESVAQSMGMASGVGFAVAGLMIAVQKVLPHLETFFGFMDPEKLKKTAEHMKTLADHSQRMNSIKTPDEVEKASDITKLVTSTGNLQVWEGIESSLRASGFGETTDERLLRLKKRAKEHLPIATTAMEELEAEGVEQDKRIAAEASRLRDELPVSKEARQTVANLALRKPNLFGGRDFGAALAFYDDEAAQKESKEADEALDTADEERKGRKEARFEAAKKNNASQKAEIKKAEELSDANNLAAKIAREVDEKAAREAQHARKQAEHAASLPGRVQAEHQFVGQQVVALDQANQAQGGPAATPGFLQHVTQQAIANVDTGQTLANAIYNAVQQTKEKIEADAARHLHQMSKQMDASQGHQATQYNRG